MDIKSFLNMITNPLLLAAGSGYLGYRTLGKNEKYKYVAPIGGFVGGYIIGKIIQNELSKKNQANDEVANQKQIAGYERQREEQNQNLVSFDFGRKQLPEITRTRIEEAKNNIGTDEDLESMGSYGGDEHNYSNSYANNTYDNESEKTMNKFLGERGLKVIG